MNAYDPGCWQATYTSEKSENQQDASRGMAEQIMRATELVQAIPCTTHYCRESYPNCKPCIRCMALDVLEGKK